MTTASHIAISMPVSQDPARGYRTAGRPVVGINCGRPPWHCFPLQCSCVPNDAKPSQKRTTRKCNSRRNNSWLCVLCVKGNFLGHIWHNGHMHSYIIGFETFTQLNLKSKCGIILDSNVNFLANQLLQNCFFLRFTVLVSWTQKK